jgi:hypothetical protein
MPPVKVESCPYAAVAIDTDNNPILKVAALPAAPTVTTGTDEGVKAPAVNVAEYPAVLAEPIAAAAPTVKDVELPNSPTMLDDGDAVPTVKAAEYPDRPTDRLLPAVAVRLPFAKVAEYPVTPSLNTGAANPAENVLAFPDINKVMPGVARPAANVIELPSGAAATPAAVLP